MVGWTSGPGLPKKEGGGGLISENRAPGGIQIDIFLSVRAYMHPGCFPWAIADVAKVT